MRGSLAGRADQAARPLARTPEADRSVPLTIGAMIGYMPREWKPPTDEQRCIATVRHGPRTGERCPKYHLKGTTVCMQHGGQAPQVRAAAARRVADAKAIELASRIEIEVPTFASAGAAAHYLVNRVTQRAAQFGALSDQLQSATYLDKAGREQVRAVLAEERKWLDSMAKLLSVTTSAGLAAEPSGPSPVELFTMAADLFRQDVESALADCDVYGEQHEAILAALATRYRLRVKLSATMIADQVHALAEERRSA